MTNEYAQVIVSTSHKDIDRPFSYRIPESMKIMPGMRVLVPFGGKTVEGYVIELTGSTGVPAEKMKYIVRTLDELPVFTEEMLKLAGFMRNKYYCTIADCLKCIMPAGIMAKSDSVIKLKNTGLTFSQKQSEIIEYLKDKDAALMSELFNDYGKGVVSVIKALEKKGAVETFEAIENKDLTLRVKFAYLNDEPSEDKQDLLSEQQSRVISLLQNGGAAVSDIRNMLNISMSVLNTMERKGMLYFENVEIRRNILANRVSEHRTKPELTSEQRIVVNEILSGGSGVYLLHGVTGSGKTEVYLKVIEETVKEGRQAIMLVPEISLTPQTVDVFFERFGDLVTVTHSRLTLGERYDQWKKARDNGISIMIGPRSAVFAPFDNLGVIIIDEEHESTYKSEVTPKYHTREIAVERARITGAKVILGSATPSVESYYKAETGEYRLLKMTERVNKMFPSVRVADMRLELDSGNMSIFSGELQEAMKDAIDRKKQVILFLNRRGYSTFVSCRRCGNVLKCENCNVNFTYHIYSDKLVCHYCGANYKNPENCPVCGSKYIRYFGVGTQKVEDETKKFFPDINVLRMDMDTTTGKNNHEKILRAFKNGEAQVLVGTQMIAKGLDFPNVVLVGIIAADISINNGDFRSGETTYQLLTQVSGRAGRGETSGSVIIQTYSPEHYSIKYAKENDYEEFYNHEITVRRQLMYPPYTHVFVVLGTAEDERKLIVTLHRLLEIMKSFNRKGLFEMLGPAPAVISKISKKYRWKLLIKSADEEKLKNFTLYCMDKLKEHADVEGIGFNITLDPVVLV